MRFFVITIIVTTVTASFDLDITQTERRRRVYLRPGNLFNFKCHQVEHDVHWEALYVDANTEVHFQIKERKGFGYNCGRGPAFSVQSEPKFCLFQIIFHFEIKENNVIVHLGILFRDSEDDYDWRLIILEVFPRGRKQRIENSNDVFLTLLTDENLNDVRKNGSFNMKTYWLTKIIFRGISALDSESEKRKLGVNLADKDLPAYYALPVAMDWAIIEQIRNLPMVLRSKNSQNYAEGSTSYK